MDFYADKTVLIVGAATDLVWRLLPMFEAANARVILIDQDADELMSMARRNPTLIEPLPVDSLNVETVRVIGEVWADEPIDIVLDAMALSEALSLADAPLVASVLATAFEDALMAADGCVVSVVPQIALADSDKMSEAAYLQLGATMAERWARWRVTYNILRPEPGASAGDMARAFDIAARAGWDNFTGVHVPIQSAAL